MQKKLHVDITCRLTNKCRPALFIKNNGGKIMKVISDNVLFGSQFVEYYSGKYIFNCDTFEECKKALAAEHIYISDGIKRTELDKMPEDAACVLVQFSLERNYTEHEYRMMRIQKKYLNRFTRRLKEEYNVEA